MSKQKQIYRQCRLEKITDTGKLIDVSWIPAKYAKENKSLSIKINEEWTDGWVVQHVGGTMDVDELELQRKAQRDWFSAQELTDGE